MKRQQVGQPNTGLASSVLKRFSTEPSQRPQQRCRPSAVTFNLPPVDEDGTADLPTTPVRSLFDPAVNADVLQVLFNLIDHDARLGSQLPVITFLKMHRHLLDDINATVVPALKDYNIVGTIGSGYHGNVELVEEQSTGDLFALKSINKREVVANPSIALFMAERDIMVSTTSPWLASAHAAFQDEERLYLVAEYFPRGDLYQHLSDSGDIFPEETARFYLAELAQAVHTLHSLGYTHRDIKPDNVLIDEAGHIALTDFGSAARISEVVQASGVAKAIGTPDYIAPEVLNHSFTVGAPAYGAAADWWSYGVTAFEMLFGEMPFSDDSNEAITFDNIMRFESSLTFPTEGHTVSADGINLVINLLCAPEKRYGYDEIRAHPFFAGVDWESLRDTHAPVPPKKPTITPPSQTRQFKDVSHLPPCTDLQQLQFAGFSSAPKKIVPEQDRRGSLAAGLKLELDATRDANKASMDALARQLRAADERNAFLEKRIEGLVIEVTAANALAAARRPRNSVVDAQEGTDDENKPKTAEQIEKALPDNDKQETEHTSPMPDVQVATAISSPETQPISNEDNPATVNGAVSHETALHNDDSETWAGPTSVQHDLSLNGDKEEAVSDLEPELSEHDFDDASAYRRSRSICVPSEGTETTDDETSDAGLYYTDSEDLDMSASTFSEIEIGTPDTDYRSQLQDIDVRAYRIMGRPRTQRPSLFTIFGEQVALAPVAEESEGSETSSNPDSEELARILLEIGSPPLSDDEVSVDVPDDNDPPFGREGVRAGTVSALIQKLSSNSDASSGTANTLIRRSSNTGNPPKTQPTALKLRQLDSANGSPKGRTEADVVAWSRQIATCREVSCV